MTRAQILAIYPLASNDTIEANLSTRSPGTPSKLECGVGVEPLAKDQAKGKDSRRFYVCFTSIRKRLLDEDNLCSKYHCDLLRYSGVIRADDPTAAKLKTDQRKAGKGEQERVIIEVFEIL